MKNYAERDRIRALLKQLKVTPQRLRGQNFLCDPKVIENILDVTPITCDSHILEIGPGLGALTSALAQKANLVTAVEIEQTFAHYLKCTFINQSNIRIVNQDALDFDYSSLYEGQEYSIYANVPYSITTPLLKKLLYNGGNWNTMVLMLQKEAAERIVHGKGRNNSPLTLLTEYFCHRKLCFDVPPDSFWPEPAISSSIIYLQKRLSPPVEGDFGSLIKLVESAFSSRRKVMVNSLSATTGQGKEFWQQALSECGISLSCRAEELSLNDFALLNQWYTRYKKTAL